MVSLIASPLEIDASKEASSKATRPRSIDVRVAATPEDRDAIFRMRHEVLDGQVPPHSLMIATNGRMIDPEDAGSILLGAFDRDGRAVASVRLRALDDDLSRRFFPGELAGLGRRMTSTGDRSSTSSDLILAATDRHVQVRLVAAMFEVARQRGWTFDVCLARPEAVALRRRLGYQEVGLNVADGGDERGGLTLMHLAYPSPRDTTTSSRRWFRRS